MDSLALREPNHASGTELRPQFFAQLTSYLESQSSIGRTPRLLPAESPQRAFRVVLEPPHVLRLPAIRAIGENGFPLLGGSGDDAIPAFDATALPVGRHVLYACLCHEKSECGPLEELDDLGVERARRDLAPRIVLAAGADRLQHRDWLAIAELERVRVEGTVRTELDPEFHPPIEDLRGYPHRNPVRAFAEQVLAALEEEDPDHQHGMLRVELSALRNLADAGRIDTLALQTQRCLGLLRLSPLRRLQLDWAIEHQPFAPESFCRFLAELDRSVASLQTRGEFCPKTLEVDGQSYMKLPGELVEDETHDFWTWSSPPDTPFVNGLAVYFPRALEGTMPVLRYGRRAADANTFHTAVVGRVRPAGGTIVLLPEMNGRVERLLVSVISPNYKNRMRLAVGDGHALYRR